MQKGQLLPEVLVANPFSINMQTPGLGTIFQKAACVLGGAVYFICDICTHAYICIYIYIYACVCMYVLYAETSSNCLHEHARHLWFPVYCLKILQWPGGPDTQDPSLYPLSNPRHLTTQLPLHLYECSHPFPSTSSSMIRHKEGSDAS